MADENPPVTPQAAPAATPVAPASSPPPAATGETPSPLPVAPTPAPVENPTVLGEETPKPVELAKPAETPEVKPAEQKPADGEVKPDGEKKEDGSQSAEPAPLPAYEPFTLPEEVKLDSDKLGEFTKLLGEFESTKPDHAAFQKFGQDLVNRYVEGVKDTLKAYETSLINLHEENKMTWFRAFEADPQIGGNNKMTTVEAAKAFRDKFAGTPEQLSEFRSLMTQTGVGNHPALLRIFANAQAAFDKFTKEEAKMVPGKAPMPNSRSKVETRYGGAKN